jgi:hypothetical protein
MNENYKPSFIIKITFISLVVYSSVYFLGKFYGESLPLIRGLYLDLKSFWLLFTFLEFLALASVVVDGIVVFDRIPKYKRIGRVILTITLGVSFGIKVLYAIMEIYLVGEVQ